MRSIHWFEKRIGYVFEEPEYLRRALIHHSAHNEGLASADDAGHALRLSWLGDGVLQLMVSDKLYGLFPSATRAELTRWRQRLASNATLARAAFAIDLQRALVSSKGVQRDLSSGKDTKVLADVLEAVLGAVFLDGGVRPARAVIRRILDEEFKRLLERVEARDA